MIRERRFAAAATLALALALTTACAPDPAPTPSPSPTGFASQEEAFAAAEATYRAYVDALNHRRSDPASKSDPTEYLTGEALSAQVATDADLEHRGIRLSGDTIISAIRNLSASAVGAEIGVCLDASATRLFDASGVDVTPQNRPAMLGLLVGAVWSNDRTYISSTTASDEQC